MMKKISILFLGIIFLFSACEKKDSMESLYRDAEKKEGEILKSVDTIARYRANLENVLLEAPESELAPLACYKLAKLNEIFGHYQDAVDYYQKLLVQYPENPICVDGLFNMAQIYQLHLDKNDDAITAYTQLVNFYPEAKVTRQGLLQLGQLLSEQEKWEDAIFYFQKIVEKYPDDEISADLCFRMGDILQNKLKDPAKAIELYRIVVEKYPGTSWLKYARTRLDTLYSGGNKNEK